MQDMEEVHRKQTESRTNYNISSDVSHNFYKDGTCNFGKDCYYCNKYSNKTEEQKTSEPTSQFEEKLQKYVDRYGQEAVNRVFEWGVEEGASEERILWLLWSYLDITNEIK